MKKCIISLIFISLSTVSFTQEAISNKAVFIELGGSGIAASLNYEQNIWVKNNNAFSLKGGLGYFPLIVNTKLSVGTTSLIVGANYIRKHHNHGINLGISTALTSTIAKGISNDFKTVSYSHLIIPQIGYRYQKPEKNKLFASLGYSPIISYDGLSLENQFFQFKTHYYLSVGLNL